MLYVYVDDIAVADIAFRAWGDTFPGKGTGYPAPSPQIRT
jgi:hypothetical protein